MIQFIPIEKRHNCDAIFELYFYMVALKTPFCPEDVFPTDSFHEQGDINKHSAPVGAFYNIKGKRPRLRVKRYRDLLRNYGINELQNSSQSIRRENDALLAKRIIERVSAGIPAERSLYVFLYEGLPYDDFHIHKDRFHCLLTSYMDDESLNQANLCFECDNTTDLSEVFRYTEFADLDEAVKLMELLEVPVCPYCNRNFTTSISASNATRQGQFDHYRDKSHYPWFALSLMNLIPACGYCNQIKSDREELVLYPYKEGMDRYYRFRTQPLSGISYLTGAMLAPDEFTIVVEEGPVSAAPDHAERIRNSLDIFHLKELYQTHQEHIAWIFRQRYVFPDAYLTNLCQMFPKLFPTVQEARDMLYFRHISPEHWGKHPLSKLTNDIDEEITELESRFQQTQKRSNAS